MSDHRIPTVPKLIWESAIKPLSTVGRVVAGLSALAVGLPVWLPFLGWAWSVSLLLLLLLVLSWIALHRSQRVGPEVHVTWSEEMAFVASLCVTNLGESGLFSAKIELLEIRNLGRWKERDQPVLFKPAWYEIEEPEVRILKDDFRHLLLAKTEPMTKDSDIRGSKFGFYHLTRRGVEWSPDYWWILREEGDLPVFVVRVSVLSDPAAHPHFERVFEIECLRRFGCRLRAVDN